MIYTVTLNPSVDYVVYVDKFVSGMTNRTTDEQCYVGGKGINVSCILSELDVQSTALGFTAGFTGDRIEQFLQQKEIVSDFIHLKEGNSRINVKIRADKESELNARGPFVSESEFEKLLSKTEKMGDGDTVILAGSLPQGLSENTYAEILRKLESKDICTIVDATGNLLKNCLIYQPFLIKPNRQELSEICQKEIHTFADIEKCALMLRTAGARNVLVSLGGEGAILFTEDNNVYRSGVIKGKAVNTVGAGDSMIAGFVFGYEKNRSYEYALQMGSVCGNATAFSQGLATKEAIAQMCRIMNIGYPEND